MSCNGVACTPVWERQPDLADLPECSKLTILPWNYPPQVTCGRCNNPINRRAPLEWNNIGFVPNVPGVNTYYSYDADHGTEYWYAMCSRCGNTSKKHQNKLQTGKPKEVDPLYIKETIDKATEACRPLRGLNAAQEGCMLEYKYVHPSSIPNLTLPGLGKVCTVRRRGQSKIELDSNVLYF